MKFEVPHYELVRVYDDGTCGPPEIVPITASPLEIHTDRRGFFKAGLAAASVMAWASSSAFGMARRPSSMASAPFPVSLSNTAPLPIAESLCSGVLAHTEAVIMVAFSPDGKLLASGSADNTIKLWSIPDGTLLKTLTGHTDDVQSVAFSPDGKLLASGSADKAIKLWSIPEGNFVTCLFDSAANTSSTKAITYTAVSSTGQVVTYTLPCGAAIPAGAVCTCNCVPGTYVPPSTGGGGGGGYRICTCIPVRIRSDRDTKENVQPVDSAEILARLDRLPLSSWNYKTDGADIRHIGPMAQDFAAAFQVGDSDRHIDTVDAIGVVLAAIQELRRLALAQQREIADLRNQLKTVPNHEPSDPGT